MDKRHSLYFIVYFNVHVLNLVSFSSPNYLIRYADLAQKSNSVHYLMTSPALSDKNLRICMYFIYTGAL